MAEYKCISCGATKDSEQSCSCPVCGYRMFETPYDRSDVLKKEILNFISSLKLSKITFGMLHPFRKEISEGKTSDDSDEYTVVSKEEDDKKFPGFTAIQGYVCSSPKTEVFFERLGISIEQIRIHIHEVYEREYEVSLDDVKDRIESLDSVLKESLSALGITAGIPEPELPELTLKYTETPDDRLTAGADRILDSVSMLSDKIRKFIRQNNIYGTEYQKKTDCVFDLSEDKDYFGALERCRIQIEEVINKKYVVDIISDGSEELDEMLRVLWSSLKAVLTVPVRVRKYVYCFPDGSAAVNDEIITALPDRIMSRYSELDEIVYSYDFLSDKTDEELFDIYSQLIELDSFSFMGVSRNGLLKPGESEKKLNELIGLKGIKESITKIKAYALANRDSEDLNIHMCFLGNPGSGKTEVARYIAGILYENKILPTKKIVEVDRSGLVSQYFGATAEKTRRVISSAMGGVLFIDEAYSLGNSSDAGGITDYGKEAIDTLVKAMEDYRGKFCVILAGYKNEMLNMLSANPGFKSRIQFTLDFPNYSRDELRSIAGLMLQRRQYTIGVSALERILDITDIRRKEPNFANAREIRNILDQVIMCQNVRCVGTDDKAIGLTDVNKYIEDAGIHLPTAGYGTENRVLTGEEELDQLIGLSAVKRMIKKIKAYAKRNKGESDFNLHMCFYGNPGTGKTEVARILSRILYDSGVLGEAKLVETDGQALLGKYVGETAPKTESKINEAMNGVLFIDEAYSLAGFGPVNTAPASYGDEAIAVLLKAMEDHRGQFCVILAGYRDEMMKMLSANPGFASRIQFSLDFPDYTREELGEIAKSFLAGKRYTIENAALEMMLDAADYYRKQPNFANARTVRTIIDHVILNQNLRTEDNEDDRLIAEADVTEYLSDEGINLNCAEKTTGRIGF